MRMLLLVIALTVTLLALAVPAYPHSWYDMECCHDQDCAPATHIDKLTIGVLIITNKYGTYVINPNGNHKVKESKDHQYHVCARPWHQYEQGEAQEAGTPYKILCVYVPPMF
jgi:hypothetical protein